ncbi:MAG: DUF1684 domain-containing protein [Cyclobacteriaceae bacterium]
MKYFFILICLISAGTISAQENYQSEIIQWQNELDASFENPETSPLEGKELKKFRGLDYYPINENFKVVARLERLANEQPFTMPTSSNKKKIFLRYAIAHFSIEDKEYHFPLYQSLQVQQMDDYSDYLFAPFTDLTSGFESYGGGRYLDLKIPAGDTIILDFNKAYNPSCAYSPNYNCPIPPRENDLDLEVKAGVKAWKNDKH